MPPLPTLLAAVSALQGSRISFSPILFLLQQRFSAEVELTVLALPGLFPAP